MDKKKVGLIGIALVAAASSVTYLLRDQGFAFPVLIIIGSIALIMTTIRGVKGGRNDAGDWRVLNSTHILGLTAIIAGGTVALI